MLIVVYDPSLLSLLHEYIRADKIAFLVSLLAQLAGRETVTLLRTDILMDENLIPSDSDILAAKIDILRS